MKENGVYSKRTFLHGYDFQATGEKNYSKKRTNWNSIDMQSDDTSSDDTEDHEYKPSSLNTLN